MFNWKILNKCKNQQKRPINETPIKDLCKLSAEVLLFIFFINTFLLQTYVIPSPSMENSMLIGDHLLVDKVRYSRSLNSFDQYILPQVKIERGMIITFSGPNEINKNETAKNLVKRVIGLPGETIKIIENKVFINEKYLEEKYVCLKGKGGNRNFPPEFPNFWHQSFPDCYRNLVVDTSLGKAFLIPKGHYFCMGDNRNNSFDSRGWGPLPENYIIGSPWRVYWSFSSTNDDYMQVGFINRIKDFFGTILFFFHKTRWERTLKKYQP